MNFLSKYIVCCSSYISMDCFEACWSVSVSKWFNTTGIEKSFEAVGACPMCSSGVYSFTRFSPFRWAEWLLYAWFRRCCQESLQYVWSTLWRSFQFKFLWRNLLYVYQNFSVISKQGPWCSSHWPSGFLQFPFGACLFLFFWKLKQKKGKGKEERWYAPSLKHRHRGMTQVYMYMQEISRVHRCPVGWADRSAWAYPTSC